MTDHQQKQIEVINGIEKQIQAHTVAFSTVSPVLDFENDSRICLTSVHFPSKTFIQQIQQTLIDPLRSVEPSFYYYPSESLHLTIKNIRVIHDPPNFSDADVLKAQNIYSTIIPKNTSFNVYFYRLLLFPNNIALIGTTDPEYDNIILDLDNALTTAGIGDDKVYSNSKYFFSNMTLARFNTSPFEEFKEKVNELSHKIHFTPYTIDSVSLVTANAVMKRRTIIQTYPLRLLIK